MNYKIVLIGEGGVGKTVFVKKHLTGDFVPRYNPTVSVEVTTVKFSTNYGDINFEVWDCAGQETFSGIGDGHYINADGAILFFDCSSYLSPSPVKIGNMYNKFKRISKGPVVLCGSKAECLKDTDNMENICTIIRNLNVKCYFISSKTGQNIKNPFVELARKITKKQDLVFI